MYKGTKAELNCASVRSKLWYIALLGKDDVYVTKNKMIIDKCAFCVVFKHCAAVFCLDYFPFYYFKVIITVLNLAMFKVDIL